MSGRDKWYHTNCKSKPVGNTNSTHGKTLGDSLNQDDDDDDHDDTVDKKQILPASSSKPFWSGFFVRLSTKLNVSLLDDYPLLGHL